MKFDKMILVGTLLAVASACGKNSESSKGGATKENLNGVKAEEVALEKTVERGTIVETARAAGNFRTLLAALEVAGLTETIASTQNLTVLAPTDEAFAKIPAETLQAILADKEKLTALLTYHVLGTALSAAQVVEANKTINVVETLGRLPLKFETSSGVKFNNSAVVAADVIASNGIVHAIDTVLLPPTQSIFEVAEQNSNFSILKSLIVANGLKDALNMKGEKLLTVFAPSNLAFDKLAIEPDLAPSEGVKNILLQHVVVGAFSAFNIAKVTSLPTLLQGTSILVDLTNGVKVGGKNVVATDILATNGIVHVIDGVIGTN